LLRPTAATTSRPTRSARKVAAGRALIHAVSPEFVSSATSAVTSGFRILPRSTHNPLI
jgi:hypothetical protein